MPQGKEIIRLVSFDNTGNGNIASNWRMNPQRLNPEIIIFKCGHKFIDQRRPVCPKCFNQPCPEVSLKEESSRFSK